MSQALETLHPILRSHRMVTHAHWAPPLTVSEQLGPLRDGDWVGSWNLPGDDTTLPMCTVLHHLYCAHCTVVHCTTHWFPMSHVRPRGQRSPIRSDDCEISPTKHQHPHTESHRTGQQQLWQKPNKTRKRLTAAGWWQGLINWSTFAASPVNAEAIKWILIQNYPQSWAHVMWLFNSYRRLKVCLLQHVWLALLRIHVENCSVC